MNGKLVYDIGMHNGDDAAYYLSRGYPVVAAEASPTRAERATARLDLPGEWEDLESGAYDWLHVRMGRPERGSLADGGYEFRASFHPPEGSVPEARRPLRLRSAPRLARRANNLLRRVLRGQEAGGEK